MIVVLAGGLFIYFYYEQQQLVESTYTATAKTHAYITEYSLENPEAAANGIAVDSQGNVWFVLTNLTALGELIPANGTVHQFSLPESKNTGLMTWGLAVDNSRHVVWFTDFISNAIWSFNMASSTFAEHKLKTPNSGPYNLALDGEGNVWFTEIFGHKIGELDMAGNLSEIAIPMPFAEPSGITVDKNLNEVWFNLLAGSQSNLFYITSYFHDVFTFHNLTGLIVSPSGIAIDPRGGDIWITQHGPSFVSEYNPATGDFRTFSTSQPPPPIYSSLPYFVYLDSEGNVWVNEHQGNAIAKFNPAGGSLIEYEIPTKPKYTGNLSGALTMNISPQGVPWFAEFFTGKLGAVTSVAPSVQLSVMGIPSSNSSVVIQSPGNASLRLYISDQNSSDLVQLSAYVGNFTSDYSLHFDFSEASGAGNFSSVLQIKNTGSKPGVYFVTISAATSSLVASQIVEVKTS